MSESFADFYLKSSQLLEEIYYKTFNEEEALNEGYLSYVLTEGELNQSDVETLRSQAQAMQKLLAQAATIAEPASQVASSWFTSQVEVAKAAESFAAKLDLSNPKGFQKLIKWYKTKEWVPLALRSLAVIQTNAADGMFGFSEALKAITNNLSRELDAGSNEADTALSVLVSGENSPFPPGIDAEKIRSGMLKAFQNSSANKFDTFAKKLAKKSKRIGIPGVEGEEFAMPDFPIEDVVSELVEKSISTLQTVSDEFSKLNAPAPDADLSSELLDDNPTVAGPGQADDNEIVKASQKFIEKISSNEAAGDQFVAVLKKWVDQVVNDPIFKKVVGLQESYKNSLQSMIFEQVDWEIIKAVFKKHTPKGWPNLAKDETLEPIIAPFAMALIDQGVEIVGKDGKPFSPPTSNLDQQLDVADDDVDIDTGQDNPVVVQWINSADEEKELFAGPKMKPTFEKFVKLFEEGLSLKNKWNLQDLLVEKRVSYAAVVDALGDGLPEDEANKRKAVLWLAQKIKEVDPAHEITDIPPDPLAGKENKIKQAASAMSKVDSLEKYKEFYDQLVDLAEPEAGNQWEDVEAGIKDTTQDAADIVKLVSGFGLSPVLRREIQNKLSQIIETERENLGAPEESQSQFGSGGKSVKLSDFVSKASKRGSLGKVQSLVFAKALADMGKVTFTEVHKLGLANLLLEDFNDDLLAAIDNVTDVYGVGDDGKISKTSGDKKSKKAVYDAKRKLKSKIEGDNWKKIFDQFAADLGIEDAYVTDAELSADDPVPGDPDAADNDADDADAIAAALGNLPISKLKFANLLKAKNVSAAGGEGTNAKRARRRLRMAINQAAGMEIFEEAFDYGRIDEGKYNLGGENEDGVVSRWKELAGIKDD